MTARQPTALPWFLLLVACVLLVPPREAGAQAKPVIDRGFVESRFTVLAAGGRVGSQGLKGDLSRSIERDLRKLSAAPAWGPQHAKWAEIEAAYRAEFEWLVRESSRLGAGIDAAFADDMVRRYRGALEAQEQAGLLKFYGGALGRRFLAANRKIEDLIGGVREQIFIDADGFERRLKPMDEAEQARRAGPLVLSDIFRMVTGLMERRQGGDWEEFSTALKLAMAAHGPEFDALARTFTAAELREVAAFQDSAPGRKELALIQEHWEGRLAPLGAEIQRRIERLEALLGRWQDSPELK